MKIIIFSYNRENMLSNLLEELKGYDVTVIDDGSDWSKEGEWSFNQDFPHASLIRTNHEGKEGFWKKWVIARQIALGSDHEYICFFADDFSNVNMKEIEKLTQQGWEDNLFAVNILNDGRTDCWGRFSTGTEDFKISQTEFFEVGFVDCGFMTNRRTLEYVDIDQVPSSWFQRKDISSGVGYQMSKKMRAFNIPMMMPRPSLAKHGQHFSQMHGEFREDISLSLDFPAYCISLPERNDKWNLARNEISKLGIERITKYEGHKRSPGWQGCRLSHLNLMKEIKDEIFLIAEDDFLINTKDPIKKLDKAIQQLPKDWDLLYLGSTLNEPLERYSSNLFRMSAGWTTHAMIFNNQNGIKEFIVENCPMQKIDVWYANEIQKKFNCFITYPMIATQRGGFSDVIDRPVDYAIIQERYNQYTK